MVGEEECLGRKSAWGRGVVREEEFGRRNGSEEEWLGKRVVREEEWLREQWFEGVVGKERWLGRTYAFTHVLRAIFARTQLHARMPLVEKYHGVGCLLC